MLAQMCSSSSSPDEALDESSIRSKRKPNFTEPERLHLIRSYVENVDEYKKGFTICTKGEAKFGRQRLLEKWAAELTAFGVIERTTIEVEQKLRDYMKKIAAHRRRPIKRPLSPAAELLNSVIPVSQKCEENGSKRPCTDSLTAYAGLLLQQHQAKSESSSTSPNRRVVIDSCLSEPMSSPNSREFAHASDNDRNGTRMRSRSGSSCAGSMTEMKKYELLDQQLQNARTEQQLKQIAIKNARLDSKIKQIELQTKILKLQRLRNTECSDALIDQLLDNLGNDNTENNKTPPSDTVSHQ